MKIKFKRYQSVEVKHGERYYNGIITGVRRNLDTGAIEYNVEYYHSGMAWTLTGVPESAITPK